MRLKLTIVFLLALPALAHGNLKFVNGQWFDGTRFVKKTMYSVENVLRSSFDGEARTIDLGGRYVVPPFADAHNHAFSIDVRTDEQLARFLRAGIFYVKNPNSPATGTASVRPRLNKPESVDVAFANGGLTRAGGHPAQIYDRFPNMADNAYFAVDSLEDLDRKWPLIEAGQPDFIKLYLEHSEDPQKRRGLDPAIFPAIVERVHRSGLTATVHVASAADFHLAVIAGVDEITHLPLAPIDPADAKLAAKRHITVVTTTLSHRPTEGLTPPNRENLALLKRAGVNVVLGVDSDHTVVDEAENVRSLGVYSDLELLRMLTNSTARAIFPKRKIGRLEVGYEASFLALDANPLQDFGAIRTIAIRVKQGHVINP
jgi:imidazolonepropionase-like amidohydrolase